MSTLLGALSQGSLQNPLTGVKRPLLGNPTSLHSQLPAFRGVPNEPGKPIKAPKLSAGNRFDRGTNVTVPVARVTALTSIDTQHGRLSPGDVCFVRRHPSGYSGGGYGNHMGTAAQMLDIFGIDGVNRMLSGSLNGMRKWQIGHNLIKSTTTTTVDHSTDLMSLKNGDKLALRVLHEHRLDGVIMSNEEPHSFAPTGERDSALFNIAVRGHAATNNGFMDYDYNSAVELYARGKDPLSYIETLRVGSERAADTWHGKVGYDFVAAYTGTYTEFPLQMFDRKARSLDSAYLILRQYNLEDDVIKPNIRRAQARADAHHAALLARYPNAVNGTWQSDEIQRAAAAKAAPVVEASVIAALAPAMKDEDGSTLALGMASAERRKYLFFQYMPCTTRAFADFVIAQPWGYIILECDEDQHRSYDPSCDVRRDFDMAASVALGSGHKLKIVRYNPDSFRVDGKPRVESKKDRMMRLLEELNKEPQSFERVFLCYDHDSSSSLPQVAASWDCVSWQVSRVA